MKQIKANALKELLLKLSEEINDILRANLYEIGLDEDEVSRLKNKKRDLREALQRCGIGDVNAKEYVKGTIRSILASKLLVNVMDYEKLISFSSAYKLSAREKFDILLFLYKKEYENLAMEKIIEDTDVLRKMCTIGNENIEVLDEDIDKLYDEKARSLSNSEKLDIITQRLYAHFRGLGVIDELRDMKIEGVSGGVSGGRDEYNSVWILFKGINIHLSFLSFDSEEELERVCMNIYRFGSPGQLSMSKGYIVNEMMDNSRVVVVRPPFAESFAFFVRKFDTVEMKKLEYLITDEGFEVVCDILKFIIKGCQVTGVTGAQGSGKTTLLMSLIDFIPKGYTLRIQEMAFELHLRDIYKDRNILTFRETDYISGQEGLDIQKKTDGSVNILGEVATSPVASWLIQMSQTGSLFTIFTHHAKTTDSLIKYMRNSLLSNNVFTNERVALEQVVEAIRFDVHLEKDIYGHRYVERISEIVTQREEPGYRINNIVEFRNGKYVKCGNFSNASIHDIRKHLNDAEKEEFDEKYNL